MKGGVSKSFKQKSSTGSGLDQHFSKSFDLVNVLGQCGYINKSDACYIDYEIDYRLNYLFS